MIYIMITNSNILIYDTCSVDNIIGMICEDSVTCTIKNSKCISNKKNRLASCKCTPAYYKTNEITCSRRLYIY